MNLPHRAAIFLLSSFTLATVPCFAQRGPVPGLNPSTPYLIHYGNWDTTLVNLARTNYRLVILHPSASNVTAANIATIRSGPDSILGNSDDVKVLAYISVGEDDRPGAPFAGDGAGPRVDPRPSYYGPLDDNLDPLGIPSTGGSGFASYYLDDLDVNGQPDQNSVFGGYYVNPGDPAWYQILKTKTKAADGRAGIQELLTTTYGNGYGCDGLFLDTLDTPAPNSFGATFYEWTAKAYRDLVKHISDDNPAKLLLANRGVFFYNPNLKPYAYTLRPYINLLMFESYYTDSSGSGAATAYFDDNKFNYAPKITAEANRADGFTVIGLGYTTSGESSGLIAQDFIETQREQGWMLYRTNPALNALPFNTQAATWNAANPDTAPPVWDSTAATGADSDPGTAGNQPPAPRTGIQEAVAASGQVTVRWDVARDQTGPVSYSLYYTADPVLNFATATKVPNIVGTVPANYATGAGAGKFANEHVITGLTNGVTYQFAIRASDALAHEDSNSVVIAATPAAPIPSSVFKSIAIDGSFADWAGVPVQATDGLDGTTVDYQNIQVANDDNYLYVRFTLHASASAFSDFNSHFFVDTDANGLTGFQVSGGVVGSELMVESGSGYDERAGGFNDGGINGLEWAISPAGSNTSFELRVSRAATFATGGAAVFANNAIRLALQDNRGDTTAAISYQFAAAPVPNSHYATISVDGNDVDWSGVPVVLNDPAGDGTPDIVSFQMANDENYLYLLVRYNGAVDTNTLNGSRSIFLSLDNDSNPATGFDVYGLGLIGAEVSWQNDFPFAQSAGNYNLGANFVNGAAGISPYYANTSYQEYRIARNATRSIGGGPAVPVFPNDSMRIAMWSDGGATVEFVGSVAYTFAATPPAPVASHFAAITVDGDFSDWSTLPVVYNDPASDGNPDVVSVKVANDDDYLYLLVGYAGPVDTNNSNGSASTFLSLDNDANPATGFNIYGLGQVGAEISWQNDFGFSQSSGVFNSGGVFTNAVPGISPYGTNTTYQEYRIRRSATYAIGGGLALAVFPQSLIGLALWSDHGTAAEFAGAFKYQFALNPGATAFEKWKYNQFSPSELLDPQISGSSADADSDSLSTLLEFAFGGRPKIPDVQLQPAGGVIELSGIRYLEFSYLQRISTPELSYLPQTSGSLGSWNGNPAQFVAVGTVPAGPGFETVTVRRVSPVGGSPEFVRLKVTLAP